jgi:Xaa-Pro aminopeptidase
MRRLASRRHILRGLGVSGLSVALLMQPEFRFLASAAQGEASKYPDPFVTPPLSRAAFSRRLTRIREKMTQLDLSCLLVSSVLNHGVRYLGFFDPELQGRGSGAPQLVSVLLPIDKDPVLFLQSFTAAGYMLPRARAASYIDDLRLVGGGNEQVLREAADQLRTWKFDSDKLGLAGNEIDWAEKLFFARELPRLQIEDANPLLNALRIVKEPEEIALMRKSASIGDEAMAEVEKRIAPGLTDFEIYSVGEAAMRTRGCDEDTFVLMGIGPSRNPMIMEALNGRTIRSGDVIIYEVLPFYGLYNTELAVTFSLGQPSAVQKKAAEACEAAYEAGVSMIRPGVSSAAVVSTALKEFHSYGFESFTHAAGHFIGLDNYEGPSLSSPGVPLEPGMVFSFHPNVIVANELKEEICGNLLVTQTGYENLSKYPPKGIRIL